MSVQHLLRDFGGGALVGQPGGTAVAETGSEVTLQSFEDGYKAGFDDAMAAAANDTSKIGTELARNLQDLSFTYQEAHGAMVREVRPLLEHMVESVLPSFARKSLAPMVAEQLAELADTMGEATAELRIHPEDRAKLDDMLDQDFGFPVACRDDEELIPGQVMMRFKSNEREINLPEALENISSSIEGFYAEYERESRHDRTQG